MLTVSQEAKFDRLMPQGLSPKDVQEGVEDVSHLFRRIEPFQRKLAKKNRVRGSCMCHGQSDTTVYLRWPFVLSRTRTKVHSSHCPYSAIEDAITNLNLRFSLCSVMLKRETEVAIALSRGAGSSSISPMLKSYCVVDKQSPAFRLVESISHNDIGFPVFYSWEPKARQLYKLFETRAASPYDRLPNGQTLLHVSIVYVQVQRSPR